MQWPNDRDLQIGPSRRCGAFASILAALALVLSVWFPNRLTAQEAPAPKGQALQLEVTINGVPAKLIGTFVLLDRNRLGASAAELDALGIRERGRESETTTIALDDLPLTYRYDERAQAVSVVISDGQRKRARFDLGARPSGQPKARANWGAVLNYDLIGAFGDGEAQRLSSLGSTSLTLEARAFSPFGTLQQSAQFYANPHQTPEGIRLDSSFRHSDEERLISYQAGDIISGGLAWSRPIRLGGLQAQNNFSLRPDLITMPLPTLDGSAALPSTVDVYVNSIRAFSKEVGEGPFSISNIPVTSGTGDAQLVIRDAAGRETRTIVPFYTSPSLLAAGEKDWSVEAGLPRLSYGSIADGYVETPVGSATLRGGLSDWLTTQAHVEAGDGLFNGGVGAVMRTGAFGVSALAVSASSGPAGYGLQTYLAYETKFLGATLNASSQMSFGAFDDLASITANLRTRSNSGFQSGYDANHYPVTASYPPGGSRNAPFYANARVPRALNRITISTPLPFDERASLSANFIDLRDMSGHRSTIVSSSYSRSLAFGASIYGTLFRDFGTQKNTGIFIGLSLPFGSSTSASTGYSSAGRSSVTTVDVVKSLGQEPGSYGWRVRDQEGASPYREASIAYRSSYGTVQAGASRDASRSSASLGLRGAISLLGGEVFASEWIDDGFALVRVGAPGIEVLNENRHVGVTNARGTLLVPALRSYDRNKITIDPSNLPVDAEIESAREIAAPADRAGIIVDFRVQSTSSAALVSFVRKDGSVLPAGAVGHLATGGIFIVGYDGQAFVKALQETNVVAIETPSGVCRSTFRFHPQIGHQVGLRAVCE